MKRTLLLAGLVASILYGPIVSAQGTSTQWTPVERSMTALLNEGWRVISHSQSQAVDSHDNIFTAFSFVLMKESKVMICLFDRPTPDNATSRCRSLN